MRATATWKQANFGAVMSGSLQLPHTDSKGDGEGGRRSPPPQALNPTVYRGLCLDDVWGPVHATQKVTNPLFGTVSILGNTGIQGHCVQVHVLAEPTQCSQLSTSVVPTATYGELHEGSS